jgi:DNA primase
LTDDRVAVIKQVKEANDIVAVVGGYVALRPAGATFKGLCPFHDDHRPSFDVDPRRQRYRCWSCGKMGDVITFIQEHERVDFREALELLARRAGITLEKNGPSPQNEGRAFMLEGVRWAAEQYHRCLLDDPAAEPARLYLGERKLLGETVRRFGLGFAPPAGDWLVQRAAKAGQSFELLEKVGLIAPREGGRGHYDRFRDRVMFPIRDARGQAVGFGGRILPASPFSARAPKYYNSADTPLFSKSELLYGLDQALPAARAAGYLAVVEGYTDVLMAHQFGVAPVVATMGTALNARHVRHLRRWVGRVVLVFDADAGGDTGVDRALEIFASQEIDLAVATLPAGLDPCDLLVRQGPKPFRQALAGAADALEFKLAQVLGRPEAAGVEGRRRAVDDVLRVIALAPAMAGQAGAVKRQLMVSRIAQRLALQEETVWARLRELQQAVPRRDEPAAPRDGPPDKPKGRAAPEERQLLELLLAEPALIPAAAAEVAPDDVRHPDARELLAVLYRLHAAGAGADLDRIRLEVNNPVLADAVLKLHEVGRALTDRAAWLRQVLGVFRQRRVLPEKQELHNQLHAAGDHAQALELLRRLQAK